MASKKPQKKNSPKNGTPPAPADNTGQGQDQDTPAPDSDIPEESPEESPEDLPELPDTPTLNPSRELLYQALAAWKFSRLQNLIYRIERTFAHHRLGEEYGTDIIFEQLEQINNGEHAALLEEINAFCDTVADEFDTYLAEKGELG